MVWENMKKREKKEIKVMCALLYMMGLCLALGISLRPVAKEAHPEDRLIQNSDKSVPADGKMQAGKKSVSVDGKLQLEDGQQMSDYVRKDNEAKKVAITFDDGPSGKYTKKLLDGLKKRKVKASFFLIGENVKRYPEIVKRMKKEGHLIGNHTYNHVELCKISKEAARTEIEATNQEIYDITGEYPMWLRPPYGEWQKNLDFYVNMFPVLWDIDTLDWKSQNVNAVMQIVESEIEDGAVILMHDAYQSSVDAALQIVDLLTAQGYEFVTVDELVLP